jgi:vancomycin aglycone glucosyltransferase
LSEVFVEQAEQQWRCFADLFDTNTTFVGSGLQFSAGHVAEARGARYLYAALLPQMFPASAWPPPLLETQRLPRWMNWLAWAGYEQLWRNILKRKIGALRKGAGLAPVRDLLGVALGKQRVLCCDPFLLPRGTPSDVTVYGAIFYSDTRRVSAEVESFLAAHSRIVYVGFGSMTDDRAEATAALIRAAARKAGVALLLSSGWAGYTVAHADDVLVIGDEPHLALFPRLSGVVHHGGAGTTHAALKSRVPQLIVAHTLDQFFWGERVARAALGPASLAKAKLTGEALAASFGALETFAANAQRVSVVEDATTRLADLICRQP